MQQQVAVAFIAVVVTTSAVVINLDARGEAFRMAEVDGLGSRFGHGHVVVAQLGRRFIDVVHFHAQGIVYHLEAEVLVAGEAAAVLGADGQFVVGRCLHRIGLDGTEIIRAGGQRVSVDVGHDIINIKVVACIYIDRLHAVDGGEAQVVLDFRGFVAFEVQFVQLHDIVVPELV